MSNLDDLQGVFEDARQRLASMQPWQITSETRTEIARLSATLKVEEISMSDEATVTDRVEVLQEVLDCMGQFPIEMPLDTGSLSHVKLAAKAKSAFEKNLHAGSLTHSLLIELAVYQVLATSDVVDLRVHLVKLAAAAMNAIEHIDGSDHEALGG
jgi:hypothetical protein